MAGCSSRGWEKRSRELSHEPQACSGWAGQARWKGTSCLEGVCGGFMGRVSVRSSGAEAPQKMPE